MKMIAATLASKDKVLAANKRLVYDFWREVFEGGRLEHADLKDANKHYSTTGFDMFRVTNGKISEHWDPATRQ